MIKTEIQVMKPNIKRVINNIHLDYTTTVSILLCIIVIIVPICFFPYQYDKTNQIRVTYFFTIVAVITMIAIKISQIVKKKKNGEKIKIFSKTKTNILDLFMAIYALLIILSTVTSRYFPFPLIYGTIGRFEGAITLYLYILLFYLAYKFFDWNEKYLPYLATSTMVVSAIGISQAILYYVLGRTDEHIFMAFSSFGNPNFFSSYLTMFLPIYILVYLKKGNPFYLITSVVTFGALTCTKTLGGYITFVIYFVIILIYAIRQKFNSKHILTIVISFALMFIILNICTNNLYLNEALSIGKETENAENGSDRFGSGRGFIYKICLDIIKHYPLLGIGPDSLGGYFVEFIYLNPYYNYTRNQIYDKAHSEYLQIATCTGIPSLICYIIIMGIIGIGIFKEFLHDKSNLTIFAVGLSILSYLIQATSNISVTHVAPIFWIILGVGYGMCKKKSNVEITK